jgi:TRAP-type C4-dicarboxylate transport system permease small subunit
MISRLLAIAEKAIEVTVFLVFTSFFVVVLAQVFNRYVTRQSFLWTEEMVTLGLYVILILGAALSYTRGYDMKVELFDPNSRSAWARATRVLGTLVTAVFAATMVYYSIRIADMSGMRTTQIMHFPMKYIYLVPVVGFGFLFLKVAYDLIRPLVASARDDRP